MKKSLIKRYSRKFCPLKSISRRSYSYIRKSTGKRIHVNASCIKSKGLRSRGLRPKRVISGLKKGELTKLGYSIHETEQKRHIALKKALKKFGYSKLIKKLNAIRTLTKNTSPTNSNKYHKDMLYISRIS